MQSCLLKRIVVGSVGGHRLNSWWSQRGALVSTAGPGVYTRC